MRRTIHNSFISLSGSSITLLLGKKEMSNKKFDNRFIPTFVPNDLPWYERDGLMTWYEQCKCQEFLENTDEHFQNLQILNFDMINSNGKIDDDKLKQYQTIDHHEIMAYPPELREEIMSSNFRAKHPGMHVKKETVVEHFRKPIKNEEGVFLRSLKTTIIKKLGDFL